MEADPPRPLQGGRVVPGLTVRAVAEEYTLRDGPAATCVEADNMEAST